MTLRLIIHRVSRRNYGKYTCEAKNDLGHSSADAVLYGMYWLVFTKNGKQCVCVCVCARARACEREGRERERA